MKKILVAGAGHGGLTAAVQLAKNGYDVTVSFDDSIIQDRAADIDEGIKLMGAAESLSSDRTLCDLVGEAAKKVSVSSTKGVTGHGLGAAGGFESIVCVQSIMNDVIPPTINYETPDPDCDLDVTPNTAREMKVKVALNSNLGFGGHNGALLFSKFED